MLVVVCVPMLAIVALHRSGTAGPSEPVDDPVEVMVTEGARVLALLLAYSLAGTTLAHGVAVATRNGRLLDLTSRLTVPAIRRLTERAVAGSLAVSVLAGPALPLPAAAAEQGVVEQVATGPEVEVAQENAVDPLAPLVSDGYAPVPYLPAPHPSTAGAQEVSPPSERPAPPTSARQSEDEDRAAPGADGDDPGRETDEGSRREAPEPTVGPTTVTVTRGDSLWSLSEARMSTHLGRRAGDTEIAPYWRAVVEENRGRLRSGHPDLIHPGEEVRLPDPEPFIPPGS